MAPFGNYRRSPRARAADSALQDPGRQREAPQALCGAPRGPTVAARSHPRVNLEPLPPHDRQDEEPRHEQRVGAGLGEDGDANGKSKGGEVREPRVMTNPERPQFSMTLRGLVCGRLHSRTGRSRGPGVEAQADENRRGPRSLRLPSRQAGSQCHTWLYWKGSSMGSARRTLPEGVAARGRYRTQRPRFIASCAHRTA